MGKRTKKILFILGLLILSSCVKKNEIAYTYKGGNVYLEEQNCGDSTLFTFYYPDGVILETGRNKSSLNAKKYCYGLSECYYPDGFPKEYCFYTDSGRSIPPTKEEILKGFETKFDYCSNCAHDSVGNKYVVFRLFIKNVNLIDQIVVIKCPDDEYRYAFKMEPEIKRYTVVDENGIESEVDIDESLYSFYAPISSDYMFPLMNGKYELKVGVFFQTLVGEPDFPSPHVSFTAIIDPDEEFF